MKVLYGVIIAIMLICTLTGCSTLFKKKELMYLDDGYTCEYRYGKDAKYSTKLVDVDIEFEKQQFMDLYNEKAQYDPVYLKNHINDCNLKLEYATDELNKMLDTQISIRAAYNNGYKEVVMYKYNDNLYFFVLCMGEKNEKDKEGWYFMRVSDSLQKYWKPIVSEVERNS